MVLEIRPDVSIDKGRALISLLGNRPIDAALYAGDDLTDIDAFRALGELHDEKHLRAIARIAIASDEAPPEMGAEADLLSTRGFVEAL